MESTTGLPPKGYFPRRPHEVVAVEVNADADRPVTITLYDHAHRYEIAWRDTADGPVITDLRITSDDGVPITTNSVKRINADTLCRAARRYDTTKAAAAARELREVLEQAIESRQGDAAALFDKAMAGFDALGGVAADVACDLRRAATAGVDPAEMLADGLAGVERFRFTGGLIHSMAQHLPPGFELPVKNKGGRPRLVTPEFLALVAKWARDAKANNAAAIYEYVAACASEHRGYTVGPGAAKKWIKECRDLKLLRGDELRKPRSLRMDREEA